MDQSPEQATDTVEMLSHLLRLGHPQLRARLWKGKTDPNATVPKLI